MYFSFLLWSHTPSASAIHQRYIGTYRRCNATGLALGEFVEHPARPVRLHLRKPQAVLQRCACEKRLVIARPVIGVPDLRIPLMFVVGVCAQRGQAPTRRLARQLVE